MPFAPDHQAWTETIAAQRQGHNPYRQTSTDPLGDPPPDIVKRVLAAHKTGESVPEIMAAWKAGLDARKGFNDQLRREAGVTFTADAGAVLAQAGGDGAPVGARDDQTGQFADLNQAARDAASQPVPGGMVPTEPAAPVDANAGIRAAYQRVVQQREEHS